MLTVPRVTLGLVLLHLGAGIVWWFAGWQTGILTMAAIHLLLLATTLWPGSTPFCPARQSFGGSERSLILTIDDGPCADTPAILDLLDQHQAKAFFFLIGNRAAAAPHLVRDIIARGHAVGNHTYTHPAHTFWSYLPARQHREIESTSKILTELTSRPLTWFRAPAGFRNPWTGPILTTLGLHCMGWTARAFDTRDSNLPRLLARLRRGFQPGAILLIHQGHPHSPALLDALLQTLTTEGWRTRLPDSA
jgi:peptidoglycan-N-acetylglucosamine deacetylase